VRSQQRAQALALVSLCLVGCFGSPSPLAPGLRGPVGLPYHGVLTESAELPTAGAGFARYRPYGTRNYGTRGLVGAIERAAAEVDRQAPNGKRLLVGDLSARYGGKISGHASHRSGRDVDLLYYATTLGGVPVTSPGFIHFDTDGLARTQTGEYLQLDVRRQWLLIRAFLTDPEVDVLWIFTSRDVEAFVTEYARSIGESTELLARAIRVMHQPRDSANHDDHLHIRVACTMLERSAGCEAGGPAWPWLHELDMASYTPTLEELASDPFEYCP